MKVLVKSDVFNICNRIKTFDSSYYIVFDNVTSKYLIYSSNFSQSVELISGRVLSYVCTLPYQSLDVRAIKYLYDTSVENMQDIIDEIDKHNKNIDYQNDEKVKQESLKSVENKLRQLT